jgi:hypothetical protein
LSQVEPGGQLRHHFGHRAAAALGLDAGLVEVFEHVLGKLLHAVGDGLGVVCGRGAAGTQVLADLLRHRFRRAAGEQRLLDARRHQRVGLVEAGLDEAGGVLGHLDGLDFGALLLDQHLDRVARHVGGGAGVLELLGQGRQLDGHLGQLVGHLPGARGQLGDRPDGAGGLLPALEVDLAGDAVGIDEPGLERLQLGLDLCHLAVRAQQLDRLLGLVALDLVGREVSREAVHRLGDVGGREEDLAGERLTGLEVAFLQLPAQVGQLLLQSFELRRHDRFRLRRRGRDERAQRVDRSRRPGVELEQRCGLAEAELGASRPQRLGLGLGQRRHDHDRRSRRRERRDLDARRPAPRPPSSMSPSA